MTNSDFLDGEKIKLTSIDLEHDSQSIARWARNSEYLRLMDSDPATMYSMKDVKEWHEKRVPEEYYFSIRKIEGDKLIGFIEIGAINWISREGWIGVGIGEPDDWGRGYGSEALRLVMRYAFEVLNLNRLALGVFEYNPRGRRAYEKVGFVYEGKQPESVRRNGRWWDTIYMGILRSEWELTK